MVNYTSIPCDAPMPQRYLFRHGNGRGLEKLHVASRDGSVPAMGVGDGERRGSVAFFSLAKIWTEELETQGGQHVSDKRTLLLSALCSPSLRVSAPGCSSYSQAEL